MKPSRSVDLARARHLFGDYPDADQLLARVGAAVVRAGGGSARVGVSTQGRELVAFTFGRPGARFLLTSLVHGNEVVGAVALARAVERIVDVGLHRHASFVALPVVNPDALAANLEQVRRGRLGAQRCNARGVDLNRNFPTHGRPRSRHPMAGSRSRLSPYFMGEAPLSEPESRAVHEVATARPPEVSLSFHSFGERLLYPYAHTTRVHPRVDEYEALGRAWNSALDRPYRAQSSASWYPVDGDLDDHLDARHGTLALTVEVGRLDRRLLHPARLVNPFSWMNPLDAEREAERVAGGVVALVRAHLRAAAASTLAAAE